jgi:hypothetical protein
LPRQSWSSTDPTLNGQVRYHNNLDQSLNVTSVDKVRKYRVDYNMNPPNTVSFIPTIASTSGRLHNEFVRLLFLQAHRETDRFFADSGVLSTQSDRGFFHYRRSAFSVQLKRKVGLALAKETVLRITINLDVAPIISKSHSPITLANFSSINLVSIFRYSSSSNNPVYSSHVDSSFLGSSLSSHRQSYIGLVFRSFFIDSIINNCINRRKEKNGVNSNRGV